VDKEYNCKVTQRHVFCISYTFDLFVDITTGQLLLRCWCHKLCSTDR